MTITVSANNARVRYTATSSQTAFAVPFEFTDNDEISVFVATTATNEAGAEKTQGTGSTHYAISGGGGATGTVTFVTGITQGHIVTIVRDIPVERTTDFTAGTTINRAALNTQLDNMTAMIGDLKDRTDRSIRLSDSDTENSLLLPSIDNRAGKIFGFNSSGGLTADTAANFDISLDDVLSNTITIAGNTNSKFLVSTALDSHLKSVGGVLNLQSQKGSNTAGISLDGSASVGIDISAGNKTIRIQDATNFTSTVDIDGALNVDGAAIIDGTLGAGASTLSSLITNTITSLASGDIDIKPLGGQVNILNATGAQRLLFDNADQPFITYFQSSNITKLGVVDPTATRNILLPNASDTLVGKATTDTLTNKTLTSPVLNTGVSGSAFLDEDNMASNSATKVASQQSIKAYVDSVAGGATFSALLSSGNTTGGTDIVVSANDDITFTDSSKAIFGAGGDLKIHHDASNSYITESGTGGLYIESSTVRINTGTLFVNNAANDENLFKAVQNFGVTLYYNNAIKIATTNTGIAVTGEVAATTLDISGAIDVAGTTNLDVVDIDGAVDMASTLAVGGVVTANAGVVVDNFTLDGTTLALSSGEFVLDVASSINFNSDAGNFRFQDNTVDVGIIQIANSDFVIRSLVSDKDIIFQGNDSDGSSSVTALTLDMSNAGAATFHGGFTSNVGSTITTADNTTQLTLVSTDADAAIGPVLDLFRNSASPGNFDAVGKIIFSGEDNGGNKTEYAHLQAYPQVVTGGSESGYFEIHSLVGGTDRVRIEANAEQVVINQPGIDSDFRVESDGNANMLFVDGEFDGVGIGVAPMDEQDGFTTLRIAGPLSLSVDSAGAGAGVYMGNNVYRDETNDRWEYVLGDEASQLIQANGAFIFRSAAAGSANGAITWVNKFQIALDGAISTPTLGTSNVRLGVNAGNSIASGGNQNVVVGDEAGTAISTGDANVAVGYAALDALDTGINNTAVGWNAGGALSQGTRNVALGYATLDADTLGSKSTALGYAALSIQNFTSATDTYNVAVGFQAGSSAQTATLNTLIGGLAGDNITTGGNNICLGFQSDTSAGDTANAICLGVGFSAASNDFSFGKASNVVTCDFDADAAFSRSSDSRLKTNVANATLGLDFIKDLRPVTYRWKASADLDANDAELAHLRVADDDGTIINHMTTDVTMHGLIAQEVKTALDTASVSTFKGWHEDRFGVQQISREMYVIPLIKAVQELSTALDAALARIATLEG